MTPLQLYIISAQEQREREHCPIKIAQNQLTENIAQARVLHSSSYINPRRACAARVTVVSLSVCLSVPSISQLLDVQK